MTMEVTTANANKHVDAVMQQMYSDTRLSWVPYSVNVLGEERGGGGGKKEKKSIIPHST